MKIFTESNLCTFIVFLFALTIFFLIPFHEMWGDELQAWLIGKNSNTFFELISNSRYEGSGALWHLMLYFLAKFFQPESMQYLHLMISTASVYLIMKHSPFTLTQKILLTFSYFIFFEYSLIARNYSIGVFLIFAFCVLFKRRKSSPLLLISILILLAHTSIYGLILSICSFLTLILDRIREPNHSQIQSKAFLSRSDILALAIYLVGVTVAILQINPPPDASFMSRWFFYLDFEQGARAFQAIINAYLPLLSMDINFWDRSVLADNTLLAVLTLPIIAIIFFIFIRYFRSNINSLFFFILSTGSILLFMYLKYAGAIRHHGFLFIVLVSALWIFYSKNKDHFKPDSFSGSNKLINPSKLFTFILTLHCISSFTAVNGEIKYEFSAAKSTAIFLKENNYANYELISSAGVATGVSGYLDGKELFIIDENRYAYFRVWNIENYINIDYESIQRIIDNKDFLNNSLLILGFSLAEEFKTRNKISKVFESEDSIIGEKIFVYSLKKNNFKELSDK